LNEGVKQDWDPIERPQTPLTFEAVVKSPGWIQNGVKSGFDDSLKVSWKKKPPH
jgi:hypothetical protein